MSLNTNDLITGFDPTGATSITGAQLAQLVNSATPSSDRGLVLFTSDSGTPDAPNASVTTKWQRYVWVRSNTADQTITAYVWNPTLANPVPALLNWFTIASGVIGAQSIITTMIKDLAVTNEKIEGPIALSKINGSSLLLTASSPFLNGDVTGTQGSTLVIGEGKVTNSMLKADVTVGAVSAAVKTSNIVDANVTVAKLAPSSANPGDMIRVKAGGAAMENFVPPLIFTTAGIPVTANANKLLAVNGAATDYTLVTSASVGNVLQYAAKAATTGNTTTAIPFDATIPQVTEGGQAVSISFTPKSSTSLLKIKFSGMFNYSATNGGNMTVALFSSVNGIPANAIQSKAFSSNDQNHLEMLEILHVVVAGTTDAITFQVRYGHSAGATAYFNQTASTAIFGAAAISFLEIEEIVGTLS